MTVKYNRNLGVFQVNGRGAYATEAEAQAANTGQVTSNLTYDEGDYAATFSTPNRVLGAAATAPTVSMTPAQRADQQRKFEEADAFYRAGISDLNGDGTINAADEKLSRTPYGTSQAQGGTAQQWEVKTQAPFEGGPNGQLFGNATTTTATAIGPDGRTPLGPNYTVTSDGQRGGNSQGAFYVPPVDLDSGGSYDPYAFGATGVGPVAGGGPAPAPQQDDVAISTQSAETRFQNREQENSAENDNLFRDAVARYDVLKGGDYGLSDEARAYQQEGLAQQRMLLERLLNFSPDEYQAQFADQALARQIALGRQGTSAAAQQAGVFAAQEQAAALYAEGARQANALEAQRLSQAGDSAKAFGELGTMTRGQDETRAQFEAELPVEIANSVAQLTQGKMNLNQEESQMFAEIWMDFAKLQSVYAGMSSAEQMAWWDAETARRGQDKTFAAIKAQIKANGAITDKDMINAFFSMGGGILSTVGGMGSA